MGYYVAYGQAEPIARNRDEVALALDIARVRAETSAQGYLWRPRLRGGPP